MAPKESYKPLQERRTHKDTVNFLLELKSILKRKIEKNECLTPTERMRWEEIYPNAILSHGSEKFFYHNKDGRITEFRHFEEFVEKVIDLNVNTALLIDSTARRPYKVPISDLWRAIKNEIAFIKPLAREEALHMSAETYVREESGSFKFSKDEKL